MLLLPQRMSIMKLCAVVIRKIDNISPTANENAVGLTQSPTMPRMFPWTESGSSVLSVHHTSFLISVPTGLKPEIRSRLVIAGMFHFEWLPAVWWMPLLIMIEPTQAVLSMVGRVQLRYSSCSGAAGDWSVRWYFFFTNAPEWGLAVQLRRWIGQKSNPAVSWDGSALRIPKWLCDVFLRGSWQQSSSTFSSC